MHPRSSFKIASILGIILFVAQLVPYAVIGEYWGMIWYFLAMPFSAWLKDALWSSSSSSVYTLVCSALSAFLWATVFYLCLKGLGGRKKKIPNRVPGSS